MALTTGKLNASALVHLDWSYPALLRSDEQRGPDAPGFNKLVRQGHAFYKVKRS